jgi:iron-sulfur cluster insertion protein
MITLTENAQQYLSKVADGKLVTLALRGGGCAGFSYEWGTVEPDLADLQEEWDGPFEGVLLVDKSAMMFLIGSTVDYKNDIGGSYLKVDNPMATSQCGCGTSFSA